MADFNWNNYVVPDHTQPSVGKPAFNWDDHVVQDSSGTSSPQSGTNSAQVDPKTSTALAALRGLVQGSTLGFADEVGGGLSTAGDVLSGQGFNNLMDKYRQHRDEYRTEDAQAKSDHPYAYTGGNLVGGAALMAIPGLNSIKALAALGALGGLGSSNAELTPDKISTKSAIGAGVDTGIGAGAAAALGGAGKYLLGTTTGKALQAGLSGENLIGRGAVNASEKEVASTAQTSLQKLQDLLDSTGVTKQALALESDARINPQEIAETVKSKVIDPLRSTSAGNKDADLIESKLQDFLQQYAPKSPEAPQTDLSGLITPPEVPNMSPGQLDAETVALNKTIPRPPGGPTGTPEALNDLRRVYSNATESAVNNPEFTSAKQDYGTIKDVNDLLTGGNEGFDATRNLTNLAQTASKPGVSAELTRQELSQSIEKLRSIDPELAETLSTKLGGDVDKLNLTNKVNDFTPHSWRSLLNPLRSGASVAANALGQIPGQAVKYADKAFPGIQAALADVGTLATQAGVAKIGSAIIPDRHDQNDQTLAETTKAISEASDSDLTSAVNELRNAGHSDEATQMEQAMKQTQSTKKQAMLMDLMQKSPVVRSIQFKK